MTPEPISSGADTPDPVDTLTAALSGCAIGSNNGNDTPYTLVQQDADGIINNILLPSLHAIRHFEYVTENHDCFAPAFAFRKEWKIEEMQWRNFVRLLCGCKCFPILLLQNPSKKHCLPYPEMIKCPTISWISDVLKDIGLSLDEVCILDVCSLFSDNDLEKMDEERKWRAMQAGYTLTEEILRILHPDVVFSCQCVTAGTWGKDYRWKWKPAENKLVELLCSRIKEAKNKVAHEIIVGHQRFGVIRGFHPQYFLRSCTADWESVLKQLFQSVYQPCVLWKEEIGLIACLNDILSAVKGFISSLESFLKHLGGGNIDELVDLFVSLLIVSKEFESALDSAVTSLEVADRLLLTGNEHD